MALNNAPIVRVPRRAINRAPPDRPVLNRDSRQARGLVHWFPLHRGSTDLISRQTLGNAAGAPSQIATDLGPAFAFALTTNYYFKTVDTFTPGADATAASFSIWARRRAAPTTNEYLFALTDGTTANRLYAFIDSSSKLRFQNNGGGTVTVLSSQNFPASGWHHIAVTSTNASRQIYVDGVQTGDEATATTGATGLDSFGIGGRVQSNNFDWLGDLKDCRVYNRVLSPSEVWAIYDPRTRWDLWWERRKTYFFPAQAVRPNQFFRVRRR